MVSLNRPAQVLRILAWARFYSKPGPTSDSLDDGRSTKGQNVYYSAHLVECGNSQ